MDGQLAFWPGQRFRGCGGGGRVRGEFVTTCGLAREGGRLRTSPLIASMFYQHPTSAPA